MPRMKGSWFIKAHQCKINKMYSNPVMVLHSPRDLDMMSQGYKQTSRALVAKKTLNTVYKFRAQEYEVAIAVGFSEVCCVSA